MISRLIVVLVCAAALLYGQGVTLERAWDFAANGHRDEAIQVAREVIKNNPENVEAHLLLGSLLVEQGDRIESIAQLSEAVRLRPESAQAQNALGEAYRTFGDAKAALTPFQKAVEIKPAFGVAQENLGAVLLETGISPAQLPIWIAPFNCSAVPTMRLMRITCAPKCTALIAMYTRQRSGWNWRSPFVPVLRKPGPTWAMPVEF